MSFFRTQNAFFKYKRSASYAALQMTAISHEISRENSVKHRHNVANRRRKSTNQIRQMDRNNTFGQEITVDTKTITRIIEVVVSENNNSS